MIISLFLLRRGEKKTTVLQSQDDRLNFLRNLKILNLDYSVLKLIYLFLNLIPRSLHSPMNLDRVSRSPWWILNTSHQIFSNLTSLPTRVSRPELRRRPTSFLTGRQPGTTIDSRVHQRGRQRGWGVRKGRSSLQETKSEAISTRNARQSRSTRSSEDEP